MSPRAEPRAEVLSGELSARISSFCSGDVALFSRKNPDKEGANEDGLAMVSVDDTRGLLAIADGMGGAPAGERASLTALERLADSVKVAVASGASLREGILDGFEAANRAVASIGGGAGTTLSAVEIDDTTARSYHVGDTGVLVVGQRGKLKHQNVSHSPVGYGVEAGLLDEEEAIFHDDRHVVSNAIGATDMKIEVGPVLTLARRDTLLIASDGLFDNLRQDEITELIRRGPLHEVVDALGHRAGERMAASDASQPGKPDDLTLLLFRRVSIKNPVAGGGA